MLLIEAVERSLLLLLWRREEAPAGLVWNLQLGWQRLKFFSYAGSGWEEDGSSLYGCCRLTVYCRYRTVGGKKRDEGVSCNRMKACVVAFGGWWAWRRGDGDSGGGGASIKFGLGFVFFVVVFFMSTPVFYRNVPLYEDIYL